MVNVGNVLICFEYQYLERILAGGYSEVAKLQKDLSGSNKGFLFNITPNSNILSFTHELNYSEGGGYKGETAGPVITVTLLDPEYVFETRFISKGGEEPKKETPIEKYSSEKRKDNNQYFDSDQLEELSRRKEVWITYGCGNDFSNWANPLHCWLYKVTYNYTGDGARTITLHFVGLDSDYLQLDNDPVETITTYAYSIPLFKVGISEKPGEYINQIELPTFRKAADTALYNLITGYASLMHNYKRRVLTILPSLDSIIPIYLNRIEEAAKERARGDFTSGELFSHRNVTESYKESLKNLPEDVLLLLFELKTLFSHLGFQYSIRTETGSKENQEIINYIEELNLIDSLISRLRIYKKENTQKLKDIKTAAEYIIQTPQNNYDSQIIKELEKKKQLEEKINRLSKGIYSVNLDLIISTTKEEETNTPIFRTFNILKELSNRKFKPFYVYESDISRIISYNETFGSEYTNEYQGYESARSILGTKLNTEYFKEKFPRLYESHLKEKLQNIKEKGDLNTTVLILGSKPLIVDYLYKENKNRVENQLSTCFNDWPTKLSMGYRKDRLVDEPCFGPHNDLPDEYLIEDLKNIFDLNREDIENLEAELEINKIHVFRQGVPNPNILRLNMDINDSYFVSLLGTAMSFNNVGGVPDAVMKEIESISDSLKTGSRRYLYDLILHPEDFDKVFSNKSSLLTNLQKIGITNPNFLEIISIGLNEEEAKQRLLDILRYILIQSIQPSLVQIALKYNSNQNPVDLLTNMIETLAKIKYFGTITTLPHFNISNLENIMNSTFLVMVDEAKVKSSTDYERHQFAKVLSGFYDLVGFRHEISSTRVESSFVVVRKFIPSMIPVENINRNILTGSEQKGVID